MKTKRLPTKYKHLVEGRFPNVGPNPCISGTKKLYWDKGKRESVTVMCGRFLYLLGYDLGGEAGRIYYLAH